MVCFIIYIPKINFVKRTKFYLIEIISGLKTLHKNGFEKQKQASRGAKIFNKALTSRNNPIKRLIILS